MATSKTKPKLQHFEVAHPTQVALKPKVSKTFLSDEDFRSWKEQEEESTFSYFVQHSGQHRRIKHFYCQHDGSSKPHSKRKSDAFKSKRIKVGHICIAKMKVSTTESGSVHLEYYPTHSHRLSPQDLVHHPLPHDVNKLINEQISVGVPVDLIYEHAKQMFTLRDTSHVSEMKANMLTKKKIAERARRKRSAHHLHTNDADAVYLKVKQLIDEEKVVLYKPYESQVLYGPAGIDELPESRELFMLGLQTPRQLELMKEHGGKILIVNETEGTNQYQYKLLTCMIVDDNRRGWPVAHLLTSKSDAATLTFFFSALKDLGGVDNVTTVITDDNPALLNAMTEGFSKELSHLLCRWHVLTNLKKNLTNKVPKDLLETMNSEITLILDTSDEKEFTRYCFAFVKKYENNAKTSEFVDYFRRHYLTADRCKKWALCLRKFPHGGINTTGHLELFHNRLNKFYLKRKVNKRLDDLIDILLQLERDDHCSRSRSILVQNTEERHTKGMSIDEKCITGALDDTWEIKSGSVRYCIVRYSMTCRFDNCYVKCTDCVCPGLCSHLYACSCPDNHPLCKHIHKLHSFLSKNVVVESSAYTEDFYTIANESDDSNCMPLWEELPNQHGFNSKSASEQERARKCAFIESCLCEFQARNTFSHLSDSTLSFIEKSFSSCLQKIRDDHYLNQ
uniref:MULE transposase domain-containing protein n=1 Tax=Cacopsylla melanoneura TaxID=428564 RepID=A0A8D8R8M3_9HEMI